MTGRTKASGAPEDQRDALNLASDALIAEYNSVRQAALSRDQRLSSLENFVMIVFSATIIGLPAVLSQKLYLVLPLLSLLLSALSLALRHQIQLLHQLSAYEVEVLRPRMQSVVLQAAGASKLPETIGRFWEWQVYYARGKAKGHRTRKVARRLSTIGLGSLSVLGSVGFPLLFVYYRGIGDISLPEEVLLTLSVVYSAWVGVVYLAHFVGDVRLIARGKASVEMQDN